MDFKHTSIKQSALGWVKKSIDDNLATIRSELNIYVEEKDAALLGSVREKLTGLQGVLTMIEQFGAAMLTEEMASLCQFITEKEQDDEQALEVLLRAVLQLPDYLERIQAGQRDIPIAILPLLNDIRAAKNEDLFSEKLLFLPDLSMHQDDSEFDAIDDIKNQTSRALAKKLRPTYQFSLLGVIRDRDLDVNLKRLSKITEVMEERSNSEQAARLWWIIGALLESIARDNLPLGVSTKMLLGKVDQVFRSMILKGEKELLSHQPIDLIKNLLFYIAQPECDGPKSQAIKTAYRLEQFLPSHDSDDSGSAIAGPNQELLKTVSDAVQADLEKVKSTLEVYVKGDMTDTAQLGGIPDELHVISDTLAMIGMGQQRQMVESQIQMVSSIVDGSSPAEQEKLLAMAAELIQIDQALELMQKGQLLDEEESESTTTVASKNFEMENMLSGVVTAALDDIQKIKDAILDFIKDSTKEENIRFCETLLLETRGALELLNEPRAVNVVDGLVCYLKEQDIVEFMDTNRLDQLSQVVVSIEYYLEALGEQRADADSILDFADSQLQLLLEGKTQLSETQESFEATHQNLLIETDDDDVEQVNETELISVDLDQMEYELSDDGPVESNQSEQSLEDQIDERVVQASEVDSDSVSEISENLEDIRQVLAQDNEEEPPAGDDSELVNLAEPEVIELLPDELDSPAEAFQPQADVNDLSVEGSVEEIRVAQEVDIEPVIEDVPVLKDDADPDILEIYLEEAEEESENIAQLQQDWKLHPEDENALKNIRRAFHTIKGSGRLVGAMKIGEFAWDYESLLNRVIDKTILPTDQVIEAVGMAAIALPQLVEELKNGTTPTEDIPHIRGLARALAEFKANQVFEIRKTKSNVVESPQDLKEEDGENDESPEDPGPAEQSQIDSEFVEDIPESIEVTTEGFEESQDEKVFDAEESEPGSEPEQELVEEVESSSDLDLEMLVDSDQSIPEEMVLDTDISSELEVPIEADIQEDASIAENDSTATDIDMEGESIDLSDSDSIPETDAEDVAAETPESQAAEVTPDPFVSPDPAPLPTDEAEEAPSASRQNEESRVDALQLDPQLLVIYQQEVESHLSTLNSDLEQCVAKGTFVPSEEMYRALHTIHGASRTADITSIGELASLLEKPLKTVLEQGNGFDENVTGLYQQGHDEIRRMTAELVEDHHMPEIPDQLSRDLKDLMEQVTIHTVELPQEEQQATQQFVDTLTMMNEAAPSSDKGAEQPGSGDLSVSQVDSDYDDELVSIFIEEATDLLEMSDHTLQSWQEQGDQESQDFGLVMELQRYLHTLKGGAKMADFHEISDLSHELESLFIAVIDGRVDRSDDLIDALHDSFDLLQKQVEQAQAHQALVDPANQIAQIHMIRSGEEVAPQAVTQQKEAVAESGRKDEPEVSEASRPEEFHPHRRASDAPSGVDRRSQDQDIVKVRSELLDNLVNSAGEVSIYRARMEQQVASFGSHLGELGQTISRLKHQLRALEAETDAQIHFSHRNDAEATASFDPLEMDRYSQIQELSKALSESVNDLSSLQNILGDQVKDSETLLLQQSRINTDLQDGLIRSRMVRFAGLTSRLRRLVRQTSSELAKKVELTIQGDQHELDIKVLDRMVAPLEHIIRNAISHGIESPMVRLDKGKPEVGIINIDVSRDGSDIVLKISDDGAGVNVEKVRSRALQLGLLGEHDEIDDNDVIQFILEPGFSTADQVSQVAGRGVGMDVVDSSIKQLGGALQISTTTGGTVFTARLPFTLSINQAILVRAGDESFALPLINIEGITRIEADQMMEFYQHEKPALDYAGQHYGLYYLTNLLDSKRVFEVTDTHHKVPIILLRSGDLRVALHIDEILGNREIVVKPLGKLLSQVKGLSGATILADGMVVLILDINGLIRHGAVTQVVTDPHAADVHKPTHKVVMVVDDSITMRRVASKLLTRNNYHVVTAKDGVDALAQLEETQPDVMLLDIEMPRMDGFELASHMRNEVRYRDIPIIMITSRTGSKHRDHAMEIGVNKYMGKPYQEEELIENIASLVS